MAIFVPEVAAPYLMKEIDKRLVISNAALDISADVPEIEWKGSEITFPVYSRVAVASQVDSKGSVTPTEIDGSKVFDPLDSFPVYDDKGVYMAFVEHWSDTVSGVSYYNVYEPDTVTEYSDEGGTMQELAQYRNLSGLPIHYTSGVQADYSCYGRGIVSSLSLLNCLLFYIIIFADILCRGSRFYNDYKTSN